MKGVFYDKSRFLGSHLCPNIFIFFQKQNKPGHLKTVTVFWQTRPRLAAPEVVHPLCPLPQRSCWRSNSRSDHFNIFEHFWRLPESLGWPKKFKNIKIWPNIVTLQLHTNKKFIFKPRILIQKENLKSKPKKFWLEKGLFFFNDVLINLVQTLHTSGLEYCIGVQLNYTIICPWFSWLYFI